MPRQLPWQVGIGGTSTPKLPRGKPAAASPAPSSATPARSRSPAAPPRSRRPTPKSELEATPGASSGGKLLLRRGLGAGTYPVVLGMMIG